jgi:anti-sigma B factor antagonist
MSTEFELHVVEDSPRRILLRVHGDLDARSAPRLVERCGRARAEGKRVIVNLAGVTFVASSGIGALLALVEEFRDAGAALHLVAPSPAVMSVVRLLGLEAFLPIDPGEDASRAAA